MSQQMREPIRADDGLGFDNVPEIYDRIRPTYPPALFESLFAYLGDGQRDLRAVEIGPATGKATRPLLEHGIAVTAVEPGPALAQFLRDKLGAEFANLDVITSKFEDAELEAGYDLIFAATAFHWVDRETRFQRCHDLLRESCTLAVVHTNQIKSHADQGFFDAVQPIYDRHGQRGDGLRLPTEGDLKPEDYEGLVASGLFGDTQLHKYRWDQTYSSTDYGDLMRSYSGTQAMEPPDQEALIGEITAFIDAEYGGKITRPLVMTLSLGRRA